MSSSLETYLVACIIINDGHIGNVLRANPYSQPVGCLLNVRLKEFQTLHNIVICDVNGYWMDNAEGAGSSPSVKAV